MGSWGMLASGLDRAELSFLFPSWETEARKLDDCESVLSCVLHTPAFPGPSLSLFQEWFNVYEHNRHTSCTVSDLIVGNEYYFRIFSENICGLSDSPGVSKNTARILKTGTGSSCLAFSCKSWPLAPV